MSTSGDRRDGAADGGALLERARGLLPKVLTDASAAGLAPRVELWPDRAGSLAFTVTYAPGRAGSGTGHRPWESDTDTELLVWLADAVQEVTMERDQFDCFVWPVCADHGTGAHATVEREDAVWWCHGGGGHRLARIGELPGAPVGPAAR